MFKGAAKVMAKDLVRTRNHVQKMMKMKTQLQAVSLRLQTVKSQNAMATAIRGVARVRFLPNSDSKLQCALKCAHLSDSYVLSRTEI